jgi:hypothetical protein
MTVTKIAYLSAPNTKLKKSLKDGKTIYSFGLPAVATCPNAGACKKGCYARNGTYLYKEPREKRERNYALSLSDEFVTVLTAEIQYLASVHEKLYIRIHDSGDFYNMEYFAKWVEIINACPDVKFYCYTKMVCDILAEPDYPDNLKVIFSYGGTEDYHLWFHEHSLYFVAKVFENAEAVEEGYTIANEDDLTWEHANRIALIYHGAMKYENTGFAQEGLQ